MKRIAILLSCYSFEHHFPSMGFNLESYLTEYRNDWSWDYIVGLREQSIEAYLYIPSMNQSGIFETQEGFKIRFVKLSSLYEKTWRLFIKARRFKLITYLAESTNTLALIDNLKNCLAIDQVSLLYVQEYWTNRFDILVNKINLPIIGSDQGGTDRLSFNFIKRRTLQKAYKLTCQTKEEVEKVETLGGKAVLLPNGVDTNFFYPSDAGEQKTNKIIFTVAKLYNRQKRLSDLINALVYLDSDWSLEIAGAGPDFETLKKLTNYLKVSNRVHFLGFIKDKVFLRDKYQQCSVFVLPSAWEGLAIAMLEAMSCGAAVVATEIPAFESLIFDGINGVKVPVAQPQILAQGILRCYTERYSYRVEARRTIVDSFSKQKTFSELAEIIYSCPN
ncbi:glycosyltransferase family 4 protein [Thermocoleostomius sinensis]|uniref:Glycosyltransferase family 4 protein n=1 Tax=Thermocoleostomius sinensis A174 TaxID=2016057 RepID=A0A9E9C8F4_9CYAN|nr:glycosyltransferase family 4 protein [Thermocoleostomius sinensis]WAL58382.1 glycosyltransferase family 4 protein [Thermocoleostomius sinensis A174]